MVSLIRRFQKPLLFILSMITAVSLVVFYNGPELGGVGSKDHVGKIYNRYVTEAQYLREARKYELCQYLLMDLWQTLIQPAMTQEDAVQNFVWNSMVLRQESERLGIQPTEAEVEQEIKTLPAFQTNGHYDSFKYTQFVQNALGPRGLMPAVMEELVGNSIRLQRMKDLLGTTSTPSPGEVRALIEQRHSKRETMVVRFEKEEFLKLQQPTDDDLKKAYEERKVTLKTSEQRQVKFVAFTLPHSEKPLVGKERADALSALSGKAEEFMAALADKGAKFEEVATKLGATVQETKPFAQTDVPAELDKSPRVGAAVFKLTKEEPTSDAIQTDKGYFLVKLGEIVSAREKTFDEAKTALLEDLKEERAAEAMNLKATEVRNKLEAELKAGKSFADAATAAGVKAESYAPFSLAEPPFKEKDGREVTIATSQLEPGQISQFVPNVSGGGLLVYLAKKLPVDEKQAAESQGAIADEVTRSTEEGIFQEWLKARRAAANVQVSRTPRI